MYQRTLNIANLLKKKSFFLFGPRATGKSFLIRQQFPRDTTVLNLLDGYIYNTLSGNPHEITGLIKAYPDRKIVVIDEVQRVPALLNEVHRLIEEEQYRFLLTGSSARKLKHKGVNLLAGRAWTADLFPLTVAEIPDFKLERYLLFGGLPPVYSSDYPEEELRAYVNTYLKEEIQAEAFVRKAPAFSRFLQVAALTSGTMLNFSSLASDTGVPVSTIREYYQLLEDTFLGFLLPAWQKTVKRKAVSTAKFYLFDVGVRHMIAGISSLPEQSNLYGQAFEHFIAMELRAYISYSRLHLSLSYWRSKHGHEVDFIVGDDVAIEVKSAKKITDKHLKNIKLLMEENICQAYYVVSQDRLARKIDNIHILHWRDFLDKLYAGTILPCSV
jgi:uncharacterized protein